MGVRYFTAPPPFHYEKETVMDMYRPISHHILAVTYRICRYGRLY